MILIMRKLYFVFTLLLLVGLESFAQEKNPARFHVALDYHYNLGLRERNSLFTMKRSEFKMGGNSVHLTFLYHILPRLSAGAGIGIDGYRNPPHTTFPVFGTVYYRPLKKYLNPYVYTNLGYGLGKRRYGSFASGWLLDAGIGYTKMFARHFGLNCQFGYNLKQFDVETTVYIDNLPVGSYFIKDIRHSLSFGFGLVF